MTASRFLFPLIVGLLAQPATAQTTSIDSKYRRFFVGSSLFMLANLNRSNPNRPDFVQLNVGYRLTPEPGLQFGVLASVGDKQP